MGKTSTPKAKGCARCAALTAENERLQAENDRLRARIETLEKEREALERAQHRPVAPFRLKDKKRTTEPKKPGQKRGHPGTARRRPDHVDQTVEAPLDACTACGGATFTGVKPREQFIEDLPEPVKPFVTRIVTYQGRCTGCGQCVSSRHPLQVSTAVGAAGVHLGPRALALAAELRHDLGLPARKVCRVLKATFGLSITPGGLTQALARLGERLEGVYETLHDQVRQSPAVYADETSWWVGGPGHWLWVFTTPDATLYRIEHSRGRDVVAEVLGEGFAGRLVSDCLASYDAIDCKKHKCYAHHARAVAQAQEQLPGSAWLSQIRGLLLAGTALGRMREELPQYAQLRANLEQTADRLVLPARADPTEERVANRLRKQRAHLFGHLYEPYTEATNNRAERQLRPAVVARKVSCGNKTARGKRTAEVLMSVAVTARQRGQTLAHYLLPLLVPKPTPAQ